MTYITYRIEYRDINIERNKAEFLIWLPTNVFTKLARIKVTEQEKEELYQTCSQRLSNFQAMGKLHNALVFEAQIHLHRDSAAPKMFLADPLFGGNLSAPTHIWEVLDSEGELNCTEVAFTPENMSNALSSMLVMTLFTIWVEWAEKFVHHDV